MKCAMCKNEAKYKSNKTVKRPKIPDYIAFYCEKCKEEGLDFGWLEPEELVQLS